MAKKPLEENGIHRAHLWEIALYTLNNTSTNTYLMLMNYIAYFLGGIVGVATVLAGTLVTAMRIWDGVTDPFVGMIVDRTNTKLGKNRPFIIIGNIILFVMSFGMFRIIPNMSSNTGARLAVYVIFYMLYILGYTSQCVVTKSAQTCLTNDPEQRPIFAMFDTVYNILLMSVVIPVIITDYLVPKYTLTDATAIGALVAKNPSLAAIVEKDGGVLNGFYNPGLFQEAQLLFAAIAGVFAILAIVGLWRKDNSRYFGTGKPQKIGFRDYADCIAHNRAMQMLVVSASTDKLFLSTMGNATVMMCLFGVMFGDYGMYSSYSQITAIPCAIISILLMNKIARKMGQKASMVCGTWGGIIGAVIITAFLLIINPAGKQGVIKIPAFRLLDPSTWGLLFTGWSALGLIFILIYIAWKGVQALSSSIVITMTADCADYEVFRTGKYMPGLVGTLFSFVDKLVSSFASTLVAIIFSIAGFAESLPTNNTPYSSSIMIATIVCYSVVPIIGWICNVVAMKFYPLTKEKMAEIQIEIGRIKDEYMKKQSA